MEIEKKFDANVKDKISLAELTEIFKFVGCEASARELELVMAELDVDGDGFIDLSDDCEGDKNVQLKRVFDHYSKDKDGKISASDLRSVLNCLGKNRSLKDCERMIISVDADGDGRINFDELKKIMKNL